MYELIDSDIEPVSRLTPTVLSDRTLRSIEFSLPPGATPVPFDGGARALYSPTGGILTKEIRKNAPDTLLVELVVRQLGSELRAAWISRNHPERLNRTHRTSGMELRLIESLPADIRRAIEEIAYGAPAARIEQTEPRVASKEQPQAPKPMIEAGVDVAYSPNSFGSENGTHQGYLYLSRFVIGKKTLSNVYLAKLKESSTSFSYLLYDVEGCEIGPILESVEGLGEDFVAGKPGIIVQLNALGLLDRTGYKSAVGTVGRARGELRKLTGVGTAAKVQGWGTY